MTIVRQNRFLSSDLRKVDHANVGILRRQFFQVGIVGRIHRPLHIGLARADPDFAHKHVFKSDGFISLDCQVQWSAARHHFWQRHIETTFSIGLPGNRVSAELHRDILAWVGPSPDFYRCFLLNNHVIAKDIWHF